MELILEIIMFFDPEEWRVGGGGSATTISG